MRIPLDHLHAPDWVRTAIFYQISPDLFWRGNESWDINPCAPADSRPCCGNCAGIREVIPYLENLGITALYLTPIFHADSYHKYDTLCPPDLLGRRTQFGEHGSKREPELDERHPFRIGTVAKQGDRIPNTDIERHTEEEAHGVGDLAAGLDL